MSHSISRTWGSRPDPTDQDTDRMFTAPDHVVRSVLVALCEKSAVKQRALEVFRKLTRPGIYNMLSGVGESNSGQSEIGSASASASGSGSIGSSLGKRKATPLYQVCVQCDEPFFPEDNRERTCIYHPGILDCDWDAEEWYDWDEDCHGPIDTEEHQQEYPDGFIWDCCDKPGSRRGCTRGRHKESQTLKRLRSNGVIPAQTPLSLDASQRSAMEGAVRQARNLRNAEDGNAPSHTTDSDSIQDDLTTEEEDEGEEDQEDE